MVALNICNDFGTQENKVYHCLHFPPSICHELMGLDAMILFFECWVLSQLFHSPLSSSSRGSLVSLCFLPLVVSSAGLRLLILLPAILIPACELSSPKSHMKLSAYKLNKQGDNIRPWQYTYSFPNFELVHCSMSSTVASWTVYSGPRFVRTFHYDLSVLGGPARHDSTSLSYARSFAMTRLCDTWRGQL